MNNNEGEMFLNRKSGLLKVFNGKNNKSVLLSCLIKLMNIFPLLLFATK